MMTGTVVSVFRLRRLRSAARSISSPMAVLLTVARGLSPGVIGDAPSVGDRDQRPDRPALVVVIQPLRLQAAVALGDDEVATEATLNLDGLTVSPLVLPRPAYVDRGDGPSRGRRRHGPDCPRRVRRRHTAAVSPRGARRGVP